MMKKIDFILPHINDIELVNIENLFKNSINFIERKYYCECSNILELIYKCNLFLVTTCTNALEIICLNEKWGSGDEIIMPSYTYVSTANAFTNFDVTPVFVDIHPTDLNVDIDKIENAITPKTKAIVVVHYAGVACNMDAVLAICEKHNLILIEDAAHAFGAYYNDKLLGTIGDYGAISFDHTKNIHCGQGGMLLVNKQSKVKGVEYIFENGTNKRDFLTGDVPYFEWVSKGSKFYLSDLNAAFLLAQLQSANNILNARMNLWNSYNKAFLNAGIKEIQLPQIPAYAKHNAHIYHIRVKDLAQRNKLQQYLKEKGIGTAFHFIPLHSSTYGKQVGRFEGADMYTTSTSERLLRMPLHNQLTEEDILYVVEQVKEYFSIN